LYVTPEYAVKTCVLVNLDTSRVPRDSGAEGLVQNPAMWEAVKDSKGIHQIIDCILEYKNSFIHVLLAIASLCFIMPFRKTHYAFESKSEDTAQVCLLSISIYIIKYFGLISQHSGRLGTKIKNFFSRSRDPSPVPSDTSKVNMVYTCRVQCRTTITILTSTPA
jgi:hypothetical protein